VSSSGHLILVPHLLGWPYAQLDPELRKSFEVALHVGAAGAMLIAFRHEAAGVLLAPRRLLGVALAFAPPAVAALLFERSIEERLGVPRRVAMAQVAAGAALAAADRVPAVRAEGTAGPADHLLIGVGQAAALVPGVSRGGATLTAARLRRFQRPAASRLSRHAALPVILGAAALKGTRCGWRGPLPPAPVPRSSPPWPPPAWWRPWTGPPPTGPSGPTGWPWAPFRSCGCD
jgi:undecaprenyl-diphosphatase